jgi:hypothetical protein
MSLRSNSDIQAERLLPLDRSRGLVAQQAGVGRIVDDASPVISARLSDLSRLRKGAYGGGRIGGQIQTPSLNLATNFKAGVSERQGGVGIGGSRLDLGVVDAR